MSTKTALRRALATFALLTLAAAPAAADEPPPAPPASTTPPVSTTAAPVIPVPPPSAPPVQTAPPPAAVSTAMDPVPPPGAPIVPRSPAAGPSGAPLLPSEAIAQFRRKKQFLIAGAILFGLGYYGALAASSAGISRGGANSREYIPGLIPIAGPFITAGLRADPNAQRFVNQQPPAPDLAGMTLYLALGVVQSIGTGVFIAGLRMPTGRAPDGCSESVEAKRPCPPVRVSFQPVVSPTFAGGGLAGVF